MGMFPTESVSSHVASKYEELEALYASVGKVKNFLVVFAISYLDLLLAKISLEIFLLVQIIYEGLTTYEKMLGASPNSLYGTLMILKAACTNNPCYIDRLITSFMRVLQRLNREHLVAASSSATTDSNPGMN